ncbi:hypothetical protein [Thiothrix subterranea]|nr:hypothetical protein [Thiothrix subterranea]
MMGNVNTCCTRLRACGGAARSAMRCEIELTMQRTKELEAL